jgi:hypothetical protein
MAAAPAVVQNPLYRHEAIVVQDQDQDPQQPAIILIMRRIRRGTSYKFIVIQFVCLAVVLIGAVCISYLLNKSFDQADLAVYIALTCMAALYGVIYCVLYCCFYNLLNEDALPV